MLNLKVVVDYYQSVRSFSSSFGLKYSPWPFTILRPFAITTYPINSGLISSLSLKVQLKISLISATLSYFNALITNFTLSSLSNKLLDFFALFYNSLSYEGFIKLFGLVVAA